jgi:hypothetical protein
LRPREAERGEVSLRLDRRGEFAERHTPQSDAPLRLGHEQGEEHRGEFVIRNDDLDTLR